MLSSASSVSIVITGTTWLTFGSASSESRRRVCRSMYWLVPDDVVKNTGWFAHWIRSTFTHGLAVSRQSDWPAPHAVSLITQAFAAPMREPAVRVSLFDWIRL